MLTDDPATPGDGMFEVNFVSTLERSRTQLGFEIPNVDLNYGLGRHLQLKFETPWLIVKDNTQAIKVGQGNSMVGVKWRFADEEQRGVDLAIYPQLEFNNPTRSVARGMVDKGWRLFLPVEAGKKVGPVEVNGEAGYLIVQHGADNWEYGFLVARQVTRRLELLGEVHGSMLHGTRDGELIFNAGSRLKLSKHSFLLFSAGRTIHTFGAGGPHYIAALGIQINFRNRFLTAWRRR